MSTGQVVNQRAGVAAGSSIPSGGIRPTETSHLYNKSSSGSHLSGVDGTPPFDLGTSNAVSRTNEERKEAIKATALTLQNRLVEERRKLEGWFHQQKCDVFFPQESFNIFMLFLFLVLTTNFFCKFSCQKIIKLVIKIFSS